MKDFDLTIIIISWQVRDLLNRCLASIYQETRGIKFEVIVVDNASTDQTAEMVAEFYPQAVIIANLKNRGFARAGNQGLKQARGNHILLLNPDTIIIGRAVERMVEFLNNHPEAGIAGCKILNADQSIQPSVRKFPTLPDQLLMLFKLHHFIKLKDYLLLGFDYQASAEVDQVMGAFFMINGLAREKIGLLDEQFYIWFEEVDYCRRCRQAGFKIVYTPLASVIHLGGQSFSQKFQLKNQWNFSQSRCRYFLKYHGFLPFLVIFILTPVSLLLTLFGWLINFKNAR